MNIDTVTFTGADNSVDPKDLVAISSCYPYVEWGILFPSSTFGVSRFPSASWVDDLIKTKSQFQDVVFNLSAHICEPYAKWFIEGGKVNELITGVGIDNISSFRRMQFNLHGTPLTAYSSGCLDLIHSLPQEIIIQADGVNTWIVNALREASVLYDTSSGAGTFDNIWPYHRSDRPFGYAGGLNIETLPLAIKAWEDREQTFWIDMETGVRTYTDTEDYDIFDLDKVVDVLEFIDPYVSKA